jgi:hypothetical protein
MPTDTQSLPSAQAIAYVWPSKLAGVPATPLVIGTRTEPESDVPLATQEVAPGHAIALNSPVFATWTAAPATPPEIDTSSPAVILPFGPTPTATQD